MNSHKKHRRLGTVLVTLGGLAFCTAANAQAPANDECEGSIAIACGSSGTTDNCTATTGVNDPFSSCTFGVDFGSVYFTFQPTATSARIRTDLNSVAPDSEFVVYEVDQSNICDETQWTEVGCADDDPVDFCFNGDICVEGLDTAKTYVVVLFSFSTASCGSYTVNIECPCSGGGGASVCGNGVIESGEDCDPGTPVVGDCCDDSCQFEPTTTECRASAGACDAPENCDGTSDTCPPDAKSTAECRASAGVCDLADNCDGTNDTCPPDAKSTAECRASAGVCDTPENCDGTSDTCPSDAKSTAECRASAGVCDTPENCDGTNDTCPADAKSTAECRASAGVCDTPEDCDGTNDTCPADAKSTAECRASAGVCDAPENCDGTNDTCPSDAKSTAECRASAGVCDTPENCDGTNDTCPSDAKSTAVCRSSAGVCDTPENCDGTNDTCPSDAKSTAECRALAGVCDAPENCDGTNDTCPPDAKSTAECRASAGDCDPAEDCDGTNDTCPSDVTITSCINTDGCCFSLSVCNNNTDDDCPPVCGNGIVEPGEACDDGNTNDGDGCSATCSVETGFQCSGEPSVCSDIDECATGSDNCDGNATCANTPGGFTCTCNPGFEGDGVTCTLSGCPEGSSILITATQHTVGSGAHPGSTKEPLVDIEVCAYDKAEGSCARVTCGGISHQHYECIATTCPSTNCCTTDADGKCTINLAPGDYIVISVDATKTVLPDPLGVSASDLLCGEQKQKHLQQIVKADGKKVSGKTTRLTGSELLIIEPEFVVWDAAEQLYPFVFETVGDWNITTSVSPPEGFVSDYNALSADVTSEIESVQFTITEIGSDLVPTETTFNVVHNGRRETIKSKVDIFLTAKYARSRGFKVAQLRAAGLIKELPDQAQSGQNRRSRGGKY